MIMVIITVATTTATATTFCVLRLSHKFWYHLVGCNFSSRMNMSFCAFALSDLGGIPPCLAYVCLLENASAIQ